MTLKKSDPHATPNRGPSDIIHEFTKDAEVRVPTGCSPLYFDAVRIERMGLPKSVVKEAQSAFSQSIQ